MADSALLVEVESCIARAKELGLSPTRKIYLRRQNVFGVFIVSYGQPTVEDVKETPNNTVYIEADPESTRYKVAFMQNPYVAGWWMPVGSLGQFLEPQNNYYAHYTPEPLFRAGDKLKGALEARELHTGEYWGDNEFVPLSYIRKLISDSGGGSTSHEERIAVLEQEVTKLQQELDELDTTYNHTQSVATTMWVVRHTFGKWPSIIQVFDETGNPVFPEKFIKDPDDVDVVIVKFSSAERGSVSLVR